MIKAVTGLFFSPSGEIAKITKKITKEVAKQLDDVCIGEIESNYRDMLKAGPVYRKFSANEILIDGCNALESADDEPEEIQKVFTPETVVVVGMPSFSGQIPSICVDMINELEGNGAYTIAVVSFGNSSYGDALYELYNLMEDRGFTVISAGAFVTQSAVFDNIAADRPDSGDLQKIIEFSRLSSSKIKRFCGTEIAGMKCRPAPLDIKGSMPTRKPVRFPLHPSTNSFCIGCGECVDVCPTGAIDSSDPKKIDTKKCISCAACVNACPQDAKTFTGPMMAASRIALGMLYSRRKEPEWFL